jgi:cell division protein FtsL
MNLTLPSFGPAGSGHFGDSFLARAGSPSQVRQAIDRRGLRQLVAGALACALLAAAGVAHAWVRTQVTEEGYRLSRLSVEQQQLLRERERLTLAAGRLMSPARIQQLARERLGMGPAKVEQVVVLVEKKIPAAGRSGGAAVARR